MGIMVGIKELPTVSSDCGRGRWEREGTIVKLKTSKTALGITSGLLRLL
jgi:hypothetical protein